MLLWEELTTTKDSEFGPRVADRVEKDLENTLAKLLKQTCRHLWHLASLDKIFLNIVSEVTPIFRFETLVRNCRSPRVRYPSSPVAAQKAVLREYSFDVLLNVREVHGVQPLSQTVEYCSKRCTHVCV